MKNLLIRGRHPSLWIALVVPLLVFALACGAADEPTATPTATATVGPLATPTPTTEAPPTPTTPAEGQPVYGGRITLTNSWYPTDYDSHVTGSGTGMWNYAPKWGNQVFINREGSEIECEICVPNGWNLENAGKTIVIDMIQGIKFHDGQEMTSADVKYSLEKIMGRVDGIVSPRVGVSKEYIDTIDTPSRYQVKINMVRPSPFVPVVLAMSFSTIYPEGTTREQLKEEPYGSGPWVLSKAIQGSSLTFDANPDYFKEGLPYLDGLDMVIVGDATSRYAGFLAHRDQIMSISSPQFLPQLNKLNSDGEITRYDVPGGCGPNFVAMNNLTEPFNDLKMRKAVNLAIDREELGEIEYQDRAIPHLLYYGNGQDYETPVDQIWNVAPGWGTGAKKAQEIEEGKQWVIDAGFPNGIDIEQLARGPITQTGFRASHEPIQQMLAKVGINATLAVVDGSSHMERMANYDYVLQSYLFCVPTRDPDEIIGTYWVTGGARNWYVYSNPEVDRLFVLMSSELDPVKRKAIFFEIQDIIVIQDVAYAPIQRQFSTLWWWNTLNGVTPGPTGLAHQDSLNQHAELWWLSK